MEYKVKTKKLVVTVKADNTCGGSEMGTWNDFVCFYEYYNDGFHKAPQKREIARFREEDVECILSEGCDITFIEEEKEESYESNISD